MFQHQMAYLLIALIVLWLGFPAVVLLYAAWRMHTRPTPTPFPSRPNPAPLPALPKLDDAIAASSTEVEPPSSRPQGTRIGIGPQFLPPGNCYKE